jgi:hypothetical protein
MISSMMPPLMTAGYLLLHCLNYNKPWCRMDVMYASYQVIVHVCDIQNLRRCLIFKVLGGCFGVLVVVMVHEAFSKSCYLLHGV